MRRDRRPRVVGRRAEADDLGDLKSLRLGEAPLPDLAALQKNVDMTKDMGFIRGSLDVKKYTDLSIVEEAAKRLK